MDAVLGSTRVALFITESESFVSRSTGRELRRLTAELMAHDDEEHRAVEKTLSDDDPVLVGQAEGGDDHDTRWRVLEHWDSYRDDEPEKRTHCLKLEQVELLSATSVTIADLRLEPYAYEEGTSDGALVIRLKALVTSADQDRVFELAQSHEYVDVVREGVNDQPESMRLGRCLWSVDGDSIRQEVSLVDPSWDEAEHSDLLTHMVEPFRMRAEEQLSLRSEQIERLVSALVEAGVFSPEQARGVLEVPDADVARRKREYLRVTDLEAFID